MCRDGVDGPHLRAGIQRDVRHFAPVKVNDVLTLDFDDSDDQRSNHYAFLASDEEFDAVLQRVKNEGMAFGSGPGSRTDGGAIVRTKGGSFILSVRMGTFGS